MFKKRIKQILSVFIAIVMILCMAQVTLQAETVLPDGPVVSATEIGVEMVPEKQEQSYAGFWIGLVSVVLGGFIGGVILCSQRRKDNLDFEDDG